MNKGVLCGLSLVALSLSNISLMHAQEPAPPPGVAQQFDDGLDDGRTPPRLSYMHGEVSFWRPGADDWTQGQINLPLAPGDALYAGEGSNLELEIGPRAFIRAGSHTQIGLDNQEPDFLQLKVTTGHVAVDVREMPSGHTIEINTPNAVMAIEESGYYRVDVSDDTSTFVAHRGGKAFITPADGATRTLAQNEQVVVEGVEIPKLASYAAADLDGWDRWNYERSDRYAEIQSARYVPRGVSGTRDLDEYGTWEETRDYGPVWTPRYVEPDWVPYSDGRWVWDVSYGWTWVDNAPWGWAPCHYGRWVHIHNRWAWAPGPVVAAPVYAPAVVAFFGSRNVRVSVGVSAPAVGWVALGWGEPGIPWWGRRGHIGVPTWRGWGGPRVVNRRVVHNTNIVHINNVNVYQNTHVRNAVVVERHDRFGRGGSRHGRARREEMRRFEPVRGNLNVRPVSASLSPRRERGSRPPDRVLQRRVVATRQPRDAERSLRAQGIDVRTKPTSPRIVRAVRQDRDAARQSKRDQTAAQSAARPQPHTRQRPQSSRDPRRELRRQQNEANRPDVRSARPAPAPPAVGERPRAQERRAPAHAVPPQEREPQVRSRPESRGPETAPRVERRAPGTRSREARPQQDRTERVRPQQQPRQERRMTRPAPSQPSAPAVRRPESPQRREPLAQRARPERQPRQPPAARTGPERQLQTQPPAVRARPEQQRRERPAQRARPEGQRQQQPALRARPEQQRRQSEVRNARPQREPSNRTQRAERQRPSDDSKSRQPATSAGDAPQQAPANRKAQRSGSQRDRGR